ncbi:MAG: ABC transporter permease subunit [Ilumatobacter sp.]|nr:ABC transporter permease subunit [Ilumatobacter sp.]
MMSSTGRLDRVLPGLCGFGLAVAVAMVAAIVFFLVDGMRSGDVDWWGLVAGSDWSPRALDFGAAPMIWGTLIVSTIALAIAAPVGWGIALATKTLLSDRLAGLATAWIQFLAVVPSVVWGLIAVVYVRPLMRAATGSASGDSILAAGLVLAAMVLPIVTAVSLDALHAVPRSLQDAARCCGVSDMSVARSVLVPSASRGLVAGLLLGLSRALGETVAVYLVIGRVDGRLPDGVRSAVSSVAHPGQTLTTKLNSPESVLAGTSGSYWATMCALAFMLMAMTLVVGLVGARLASMTRATRCCGPNRGTGRRSIAVKDGATRAALVAALLVGVALSATVFLIVAARGIEVASPGLLVRRSSGVTGGGLRDQGLGSGLLILTAALLACPVGCLAGLFAFRGVDRRPRRTPRIVALVLAGVPSIVLGLAGYGLLISRFGLGKSWLAGGVVLAIVAVPYVVVAVSTRVDAAPPSQVFAASTLGLGTSQTLRSVVYPFAKPALISGSLLGLARAIGETAPLLFTATVFAGASFPPSSIADAPVVSLPTHLFTIVQDSTSPEARQVAWATALTLLLAAQLMVVVAQVYERRARREVAT